ADSNRVRWLFLKAQEPLRQMLSLLLAPSLDVGQRGERLNQFSTLQDRKEQWITRQLLGRAGNHIPLEGSVSREPPKHLLGIGVGLLLHREFQTPYHALRRLQLHELVNRAERRLIPAGHQFRPDAEGIDRGSGREQVAYFVLV